MSLSPEDTGNQRKMKREEKGELICVETALTMQE